MASTSTTDTSTREHDARFETRLPRRLLEAARRAASRQGLPLSRYIRDAMTRQIHDDGETL